MIAGFDPNLDRGEVDALAVGPGHARVYAGGVFSFAGANTIYNRLAAVNADGTIDSSVQPEPQQPGRRHRAVGHERSPPAARSSTVQAGRRPARAGARPPRGLRRDERCRDRRSTPTRATRPCMRSWVSAAARSTPAAFLTVGATPTPRNRLAAFDPATGAVTPGFDPNIGDDQVSALAYANGKLYAGGGFTTVNLGTPPGNAMRLAAFDASRPARSISTFDANVNGDVDALVLSAGGALCGRRLARSTAARRATCWPSSTPRPGRSIRPFRRGAGRQQRCVRPGAVPATLYAGGSFMPTGGDTGPSFLAGFDASTGADLAAFDPGLDGARSRASCSPAHDALRGRQLRTRQRQHGAGVAGMAGFDAATGAARRGVRPRVRSTAR